MSLSGWLSGQSTFIFSFIVVFFRIKTHIKYFSFEIYNFKRVFHTKMFFVGFQSTSLCFSCHCLCLFNTPLYVFIYPWSIRNKKGYETYIFKARQVVKRKHIVKKYTFYDVHHFLLCKNYVFVDRKEGGYHNFLNDDYLCQSNFFKNVKIKV